jgi:transaldolase
MDARLNVGRLQQLHAAGVSIWLDTLSRELLESGELKRLITDFAVTGATSNPTIFARAITNSDLYDRQLEELLARGVEDPHALFLELAMDDVAQAAALLRATFDASSGRDGFISLECTPDLAAAAERTVEQALWLWKRLELPNLLIKVPATDAGVTAIEELTFRGVNVNVTLLFSLRRHEQVIDAYLRGLERRLDAGQDLAPVTSVASFFVSRVDSKADGVLPPGSPLRGKVAIANAIGAYRSCRERFSGPRWGRLAAHGARPQRPLWASTGTKNPAYDDLLYVEGLIAPDTINTMPEATLNAFHDHGTIGTSIEDRGETARHVLAAAAAAGLELDEITAQLEREGIETFCSSYAELLGCIETKVAAIRARSEPSRRSSSVAHE